MTAFRPLFCALALAIVSACATPAISPEARPGPQSTTGAEAGRLFAKGCVQTLPDFAGIGSALGAEPVLQHPTLGTYYHQTLNLSIKAVNTPQGSYCSIVFASTQAPEQVNATFAGAIKAIAPNAQGGLLINEPRPYGNGVFLYNFRTAAQ